MKNVIEWTKKLYVFAQYILVSMNVRFNLNPLMSYSKYILIVFMNLNSCLQLQAKFAKYDIIGQSILQQGKIFTGLTYFYLNIIQTDR